MQLEHKVAVITGAGSGIGQATAQLFAATGAKVVVADLDEIAGAATVDLIRASGGAATFVRVDVADPQQVDAMVSVALDRYGGIDILFNNAAMLVFGKVVDTPYATWQRVMNVNLNGVFLCCKAVIPHMLARGGGSIINMSSSTGAHDGNGNAAAYVTSKGGVTLLTRCLAIDHAQDGIRVNAIAPGPTDTPMLRGIMTPAQIDAFAATFPARRLGQPREIAQAALFLASDAASFVTGSVLAVDGGQTAQV
ncbi:MAG: glucose 1-dehydrogenase [Anaerolineales bacterium]|nr:glucose 1-dehydrogenase [Anaerolineales bacterium]